MDGKANAVCIEFFAKLLKVPRASVSIASGEASRSKVVRVVGLSADELRVGSRIKNLTVLGNPQPSRNGNLADAMVRRV